MKEELNQEQKEELVDKINEDLQTEEVEEGNTSIFNLEEMGMEAPKTPQEAYDRSLMANATSLATLEMILNSKDKFNQISRKNLVKLIFAILNLPREGAELNFGGTEEQKKLCYLAFSHMQMANNARTHIIGVNAMRRERAVARAKAEQESNNSEIKENENE